ncbi:Group-specific protein [Acanthamoeba castellanii str. Neff]|uniref:Group-specific protein n=1 Tax=Acanthamoeba castellanii (strain ATCC 30010 / Neff) TaxID=1257118 RepID=L8HCG2_ACACF|nr:Group-specific protein [Acanthamoeba castellanii str. Neff]ELR22885.1 Group-specific protein [Acanthamoeba castellanii str. Neff]
MDAARELYAKPPSVDGLWDQPVFTALPASNTPDALLDRFSSIYYGIGSVQFARFSMATEPRLDWFLVCNRENEIHFFAHLLASPAVRAPKTGSRTLRWEALNATELADKFASVLQQGGAYKRYQGGDAKAVSQQACQVLLGDHPEDQLVFRTSAAWSPWFGGVVWDNTWIGINKSTRRIWLLCATDSD